MEPWPSKWYCVIWGGLGFLTLLSGVFSRNVVDMLFGTVILFLASSAFLMYYVKSEHRAKKALEVVFTIVALVTAIYGYVVTGSLFLEIFTLFTVVMVFFAFVASYLWPRVLGKTKSYNPKSYEKVRNARMRLVKEHDR